MYHIINVVRYPLWRAMDYNLVICTISTVLLINTPCSEYPVKALRLKNRSQEYDKGGNGVVGEVG